MNNYEKQISKLTKQKHELFEQIFKLASTVKYLTNTLNKMNICDEDGNSMIQFNEYPYDLIDTGVVANIGVNRYLALEESSTNIYGYDVVCVETEGINDDDYEEVQIFNWDDEGNPLDGNGEILFAVVPLNKEGEEK